MLQANQRLLYGNLQLPLPATQWQREVQAWNGIALKALQGSLLQYIQGPDDAQLQGQVERPTTAAGAELCRRARLRAGASAPVANVATAGLFLTLLLGVGIVGVSVWLDWRVGRRGDGEKTGAGAGAGQESFFARILCGAKRRRLRARAPKGEKRDGGDGNDDFQVQGKSSTRTDARECDEGHEDVLDFM